MERKEGGLVGRWGVFIESQRGCQEKVFFFLVLGLFKEDEV